LDQAKINNVVNTFFTSLKADEDKMLETGLTNNATVEILRQAVLQLIQDNPKKFEQYIKFFEIACMYLQNETDEVPEIEKNE
jgi:hypothetical protein